MGTVTVDLPFLALVFIAGVVFGWFIIWLMSRSSPPPKEATAENFVDRKLRTAYHPLDWLGGNKKELTLHRLRILRSFRMSDYVRPHMLTDPEWRRARKELLDCNILHIPKGTTALLTQHGGQWVEDELGTCVQTLQTVKAGEGDPSENKLPPSWITLKEL